MKNDVNYQDWCTEVSQDLQQIAVLHDREASKVLITALREVNFPYNLGFPVMASNTENCDWIEPDQLFASALEALPETIDQQTLDQLAVDYADIYLNHGLHASPFESVWLDEDHLIQQEPMFKIREWYQRYGLSSSDWRVRSEDHLVLQIQFISMLLDPDSAFPRDMPLQKRLEDAAHFMDEHLLLWLSDFTNRVMQRSATDFYASVAFLTNAYIEQLRDTLAEITDVARLTEEEIEEKLTASQPPVEQPVAFMPGATESW